MLYISIKFGKVIFNGIKVIERTGFLLRIITSGKCMWSDRYQSLHVVLSCFIFVPSFEKLSQTVSKLKSGHDFYAEHYKRE